MAAGNYVISERLIAAQAAAARAQTQRLARVHC